MAKHQDSLSVLVVDNTPEILVFLARVLQSNDIRPLLARDSPEALGIAERAYVPIDLVLTNIVAPGLNAYQLVNRLREIRPGLRALYMSAQLDSEVIRVELMPAKADTGGLIESIRSASRAPLVRAAGVTQSRPNWTVQ